jgi:hypothetical protein
MRLRRRPDGALRALAKVAGEIAARLRLARVDDVEELADVERAARADL